MRVTQAGAFTRSFDVTPIQALPGQFQLSFTSYMGGTRNPEDPRTELSITVDYDGLWAIRNEIISAMIEYKRE